MSRSRCAVRSRQAVASATHEASWQVSSVLNSRASAVHLRIRGAPQEFSLACLAQELVSVNDDSSPRQDYVGHACDLNSFEHGVVDAHVMRRGADGVLAFGIEDDEVR